VPYSQLQHQLKLCTQALVAAVCTSFTHIVGVQPHCWPAFKPLLQHCWTAMPKHLGRVLGEDDAGDGVGELHCAVMALLSAWAIATVNSDPGTVPKLWPLWQDSARKRQHGWVGRPEAAYCCEHATSMCCNAAAMAHACSSAHDCKCREGCCVLRVCMLCIASLTCECLAGAVAPARLCCLGQRCAHCLRRCAASCVGSSNSLCKDAHAMATRNG
jgi:hypothetical protein